MIKAILIVALLIAVAGFALRWLVTAVEPHLTFYPRQGLTDSPGDRGLDFEQVRIETQDGEELRAWFLPHSDPLAEVVFFHGNAGNLSLWLDFLSKLARQRLAVLAVDYRGYGVSSGSPTEEGLLLDARATVQAFWERVHHPDRKVVYWGRSLGGVAASYAASVREPDGIILEATFPDKRSLLHHYPVLRILSPFSKYRLATVDYLTNRRCPVLVVHGSQDSVVPVSQGRSLFEQLNAPKKLLIVEGAGHNDVEVIDPEVYWEGIATFLKALRDGPDSH